MSEPVRDVIIKINEAPASKVEEIYWETSTNPKDEKTPLKQQPAEEKSEIPTIHILKEETPKESISETKNIENNSHSQQIITSVESNTTIEKKDENHEIITPKEESKVEENKKKIEDPKVIAKPKEEKKEKINPKAKSKQSPVKTKKKSEPKEIEKTRRRSPEAASKKEKIPLQKTRSHVESLSTGNLKKNRTTDPAEFEKYSKLLNQKTKRKKD